jgi:hypothetical protein
MIFKIIKDLHQSVCVDVLHIVGTVVKIANIAPIANVVPAEK